METKQVKDLVPGDVIDGSGIATYLPVSDRIAADCEYIVVESVNGGWADAMAVGNEVVLYSTDSLSEPVLIPGDREVSVLDNVEQH